MCLRKRDIVSRFFYTERTGIATDTLAFVKGDRQEHNDVSERHAVRYFRKRLKYPHEGVDRPFIARRRLGSVGDHILN